MNNDIDAIKRNVERYGYSLTSEHKDFDSGFVFASNDFDYVARFDFDERRVCIGAYLTRQGESWRGVSLIHAMRMLRIRRV